MNTKRNRRKIALQTGRVSRPTACNSVNSVYNNMTRLFTEMTRHDTDKFDVNVHNVMNVCPRPAAAVSSYRSYCRHAKQRWAQRTTFRIVVTSVRSNEYNTRTVCTRFVRCLCALARARPDIILLLLYVHRAGK